MRTVCPFAGHPLLLALVLWPLGGCAAVVLPGTAVDAAEVADAVEADRARGDAASVDAVSIEVASADGGAAAAPVRLRASRNFTCALRPDRSVWCWGMGYFPREDGSVGTFSGVAERVPGLSATVDQLVVGPWAACVTALDRAVTCWGYLIHVGIENAPQTPTRVPWLDGATSIGVGYVDTCGRFADGSVRCVRNATFSGAYAEAVASLAVSENVVCGALERGGVRCSDVSETLALGQPVREVAVGAMGVCVLLRDGTVHCANRDPRSGLRLVAGVTGAVEITVGQDHACARLEGGSVWCWGSNRDGQLGDGTTVTRAVPMPVVGLSSVVSIAAGSNHTCAALVDGSVRCWGDRHWRSDSGLPEPTPVPIPGF